MKFKKYTLEESREWGREKIDDNKRTDKEYIKDLTKQVHERLYTTSMFFDEFDDAEELDDIKSMEKIVEMCLGWKSVKTKIDLKCEVSAWYSDN